MSFQAFNPDLLPKPVIDPLGWRRIPLKEACRIGLEAAEKGWPWKDNMLRDDAGRPVMLANHPNFPPTYWVPTEVTPLDIEITRVTGNLTALRNATSDGAARAWCVEAVALIRKLAKFDEEAAAQWLMEDDTSYAAEPDFARRAARHMLAAARGNPDPRETYINAAQPVAAPQDDAERPNPVVDTIRCVEEKGWVR